MYSNARSSSSCATAGLVGRLPRTDPGAATAGGDAL